MSKPRKGDAEEVVSLDGLMDTMTNVVGTLLLILIVVQLRVNLTASKIEQALANVTAQQVQELKLEADAEAQKAQAALADWEKRKPGEKKIYEDLAAKREEVGRQEVTLQERGVKLLSLDELEKQINAKATEAAQWKKDVGQLIAERGRLQGLLDKTPQPQLPPPVDVRVPESHPLPKNPDYVRMLILSNRVYVINEPLFEKTVGTILENTPQLVLSKKREADGKISVTYKHQESVDLLNSRNLGDKNVELKFPLNKAADRLTLLIVPRPDGGETEDKLESAFSPYRTLMTQLGKNPNAVLWFHVHPDSVGTYLVAREQCSRFNVNAGWEFHASASYSVRLPFPVNVIQRPPPPRPGARPPPVPARPQIEIPKPKKTLD